MKKIPTIFQRDWNGNRKLVLPKPNLDCLWVLAGDGKATRKFDGTCCLIRNAILFKRRELKRGELAPPGFEKIDTDAETGKTIGWVPVSDGAEDRWHREAYAEGPKPDGTYELIGPKVQGNAENCPAHVLLRHGNVVYDNVPRDFLGLKEWLAVRDIEGLVFCHPDGRMAKIKLRDFGLQRGHL